jgi:hypothetical protein
VVTAQDRPASKEKLRQGDDGKTHEKTRQKGKGTQDRITLAGQAGQPEQDSQSSTAGTGQPRQAIRGRRVMTEHQERTAGKVSLDRLTW